jgi:hypothetical protein
MVNASKKNLLPLSVGIHRQLNKLSTRGPHQANIAKSGLEAERVRALGALRSMRHKKKLSAEKGRKMHF